MRLIFFFVSFFLLLGVGHYGHAAERSINNPTKHSNSQGAPTAPWLQPKVLKAALAIQLQDQQTAAFRTALAELINGRRKALARLRQQENVSDLKQRTRSITNRHFRKMERQMVSVLSTRQIERYRTYAHLLKAAMTDTSRSQAQSKRGDTDAARTSLNANNVSH